ncbi:MAG: ferritin-like domain-containing protein [Chromatiales bacterium]|jgi:CDGSH-type Zn-finger protein
MVIEDIEDLREHLQWALEIEHATVPPYMCALYSIPDGANPECTEILRSVLMEEMLHLSLAANILNAVGGAPQLDRPDFVPRYPARLPHSGMATRLSLAPFTPETVHSLMSVEHPEADDAPPQDEGYRTIAQFYAAIEAGLVGLTRELGHEGVFTGDPTRQVRPDGAAYGGSGRIIPVRDLGSALEALAEIVEQGEGMDQQSVWDGDRNMFHPERDELGHYFRLRQILEGRFFRQGDTPRSGPSGERFRVDWDAARPMAANPGTNDHPPGSDVRSRMEDFGREYTRNLRLLHRVFNGEPEQLGPAVGSMYEVGHLARALMQIPLGDGTTAGPTFEPPAAPDPGALPVDRTFRVEIRPDGPYVVYGGLPLMRKEPVTSEMGESLTWRTGTAVAAGESYALCRCGGSASKPFCDGSHSRVGFDGTESASREPLESRQTVLEGVGLRVRHDPSLCAHAGFCFNRATNVRRLLPQATDIQARTQLMAMIERCPSGSLAYDVPTDEEEPEGAHQPVEPDLTPAIAVTPDGPLWLTGGIPFLRSDGHTEEIRGRVTLCRCGRSANKPYCDGTHLEAGFTD